MKNAFKRSRRVRVQGKTGLHVPTSRYRHTMARKEYLQTSGRRLRVRGKQRLFLYTSACIATQWHDAKNTCKMSRRLSSRKKGDVPILSACITTQGHAKNTCKRQEYSQVEKGDVSYTSGGTRRTPAKRQEDSEFEEERGCFLYICLMQRTPANVRQI